MEVIPPVIHVHQIEERKREKTTTRDDRNFPFRFDFGFSFFFFGVSQSIDGELSELISFCFKIQRGFFVIFKRRVIHTASGDDDQC